VKTVLSSFTALLLTFASAHAQTQVGAFFAFQDAASQSAANGLGTYSATVSANTLPGTPTFSATGSVFATAFGNFMEPFTAFNSSVWSAAKCAAWNATTTACTGNSWQVILDTRNVASLTARFSHRFNGVKSAGILVTSLTAFEYKIGSGAWTPVPGAILTVANSSDWSNSWSMNLSSVTVLNNQPEVTLRWRFPDLDQLTSAQVRMDNLQITGTYTGWLSGTTLTPALLGTPYTTTIQFSGVTGPYTYALKAGSALPTGFSLDSSTGVLTGTSTNLGNALFTIVATDASTPAMTSERTFTLATTSAWGTASIMPIAKVGTSYTQTLQYNGGTQPYTYALKADSTLPTWLSLSSTGVLSGMPNIIGTHSFTITVSDSSLTPITSDRTFTLSTESGWVTASSLPSARTDTTYSIPLQYIGQTGPYTFSIKSGSSLPSWLTLSSAGVLSGTPATNDVANLSFTILATDTSTPPISMERAFTLKVAKEPNIVIFIADDLSWYDVKCFGGPTDALTPNLDRLAGQGMKLTRCYSSAAVCSPTRQALLTGMYPIRSGAYPNHALVKPGLKSLPYYLKNLKGYRTLGAGKQHFDPVSQYPFDHWLNEINVDPTDSESGFIDFASVENFMKAEGGSPFFAYLATHEPHGPHTLGDQTAFPTSGLTTFAPNLIDTPELRSALSAYYREVTLLDNQVGEVMEMLKRTGQEENTIFIFVSEQGGGMPMGKFTLYEGGIRAAAIAVWPGKIAAGSSNPALVQYEDIAPTLLAAAGADPTSVHTGVADTTGYTGFDGRSILGVLKGQTTDHRDYIFAQHTARGINNGPVAYGTRAVSDGRWKLIVNLEPENTFSGGISNSSILSSWRTLGQAGNTFAAQQAARYTTRPALELYDLSTDPWELTNLAMGSDHSVTLARLQNKLAEWMTQQGDKGHQTELEAYDHQTTKVGTEFTIEASAGPGGAISPQTPFLGATSPSVFVRVTKGASQTFNILPAPGYTLSTLKVNGNSVTPASSYTFSNVTSTQGISATFDPVPTPSSIWKQTHFNSSLNESLVSGDLADPDQDGIANLLERALGLNPNSASSSGLPTASWTEMDGGKYITLTVNKSSAATDLVYAVEVSGDLLTWNAGSGHTTILENTETLLRVRGNTPMSSTTPSKVFLRLKVTTQ
jgi:uncharacterized sulfatase